MSAYAFTAETLAWLQAAIVREIPQTDAATPGKGGGTAGNPAAWLLREARMQAAVLVQLGAALDRADVGATFFPEAAPADAFSEFDSRLDAAADGVKQ